MKSFLLLGANILNWVKSDRVFFTTDGVARILVPLSSIVDMFAIYRLTAGGLSFILNERFG